MLYVIDRLKRIHERIYGVIVRVFICQNNVKLCKSHEYANIHSFLRFLPPLTLIYLTVSDICSINTFPFNLLIRVTISRDAILHINHALSTSYRRYLKFKLL